MSRAQLTSTVEQNTGGAVAPYVAGKNFLVNGGFDIWQRATTTSTVQATYSTADRWYANLVGTTTISQETSDIPSAIGIQYALKYVTSAGSSYAQYYQALEQAVVKPIRGQTFTISAYVKLTGGYVGTLYSYIDYSNSSDALGSQTTNVAINAFGNASNASGWTRFTGTFTVPSDAVGLRVGFLPDNAQGSGVTVRIAGVQLEQGKIATPFSRAGGTLSGELTACQRYYQRFSFPASNYSGGFGTAGTTTNAVILFPRSVSMRVTPTAIENSTVQVYDGITSPQSVTLTNASSSPDALVVTAGGSGLTAFRPYFIIGGAGASYIGFTAEL
jgi:hypothetical protein